MRRSSALIGALALTFSASMLTATSATASVGAAHRPKPCLAVAHHEDASHNGNSCATLATPRVRKWSVKLAGPASYPLIANGKVFVTTASTTSYGASVYALNAASGKIAWGPIPISGTYYWSSLAYGDGLVFVNNFDGTVTAFDASTGQQKWTQTTGYFSGELVASNGVLYLHDAYAVYAISERTGAVIWESGGLDGDGSSVSVNGTGVYVAAGCSWYRLSLSSGSVLWSGNSGCNGGGGGTTYLSQGRDFVGPVALGGDLIVSQSTGRKLGTFSGTPAFSGENGYFVSGTTIFCENVRTLTPIYSKSLPSAAATSPVIAGSVLYLGAANAKVYGISTTTGKVIWRTRLPGVPGGGGQYSSPISDIAVGEGMLVVPTGYFVTAFK